MTTAAAMLSSNSCNNWLDANEMLISRGSCPRHVEWMMKTEDLIGALAQDGLGRRGIDRAIGLSLLVGCAVATIVFFWRIGFRPDIDAVMMQPRFMLKFAVTLPLAATAAAFLLRIARPGVPYGPWGWALAISPIILTMAVVVELFLLPEAVWARTSIGSNARHCLTLIPLLALGPLACLLLALREGAPTHPGLAGAAAGLAASGIGASLYATNCTDDSPLFVATWYPIATAFVVGLGYLGGRRFLRW